MIKLDNKGGEPFNFNRIPLWLYPDLFEEHKNVIYRGWWFVFLYLISTLLNMLLIFGPISIFMFFGGGDGAAVALYVWLAIGTPFGICLGLLMWREFNLQSRNLKQRENNP